MATAELFPRNDGINIKKVMQNLYELFGDVLEKDIIKSVALNCNYNLETTTNVLLDMLNNVNHSSNGRQVQNTTKQIHQNGVGFSYANVASTQKYRDNADVVIESEKIISSNHSSSNLNLEPTKNILVNSKQRSKKELEVERIIQHIRQESRILIFMRGLPGSGKSYLAKNIIDRSIGITDYYQFILSTDDYFYNGVSGKYVYDVTKLQEAHEWNQQRAYMQMSSGVSPVIIDNTNTQIWEMKSYAMMATNFGYIVEIVEPFTPWAFDVKQLFVRNKHGVPKAKLSDMLSRYDKNVTPTDIFTLYNLSYVNLIPPVRRIIPPPTLTTAKNKSNEIDLIGLNETKASEVLYWSGESNEVASNSSQNSNINLLDSFLTDSQINEKDILKPSINNVEVNLNKTSNIETTPKVKETSNSSNMSPDKDLNNIDKKSDTKRKKNYFKKPIDVYPTLDLSSWGLSQDAVSSWDSWDVVTPLDDTQSFTQSIDVNITDAFQKSESKNSSTNTSSYDFSLLDTNCLTLESEGIQIIRATGRDININNSPISPTSPPKKILLHKSSMTDEDILDADTPTEAYIEHIQQLEMWFPTMPVDFLKDVYEKCGRCINWAVDLLLDDSKEILTNGVNTTNKSITSTNFSSEPYKIVEDDYKLNVNQTKTTSNISNDSAEVKLLKKHIEQSIEINRDHYSDHVMKLKSVKHSNETGSKKLEHPSTSKSSNFEVYPTSSGQVIALKDDIDVDDFEPDIDFPQNEVEEHQTIEINLGDTCINQLESLFGFPEMFPKGFLPVVQIPLELAEQLHAFYIQSVLGQMEVQNNVLDAIIKEDEELAKQIQKQEEVIDGAEDNKKMDLQEIMKEQFTDKLNRKKVDEWKKLTPDTLAFKLTVQKLINSFPSVDKVVLMEILHAHNNCYAQTVETLLASTDANKVYDPDGNIREPPITETVIRDMNKAQEEKNSVENAPDISKTANEYREEANEYLKKHNEHMQKAQRAFQSRQYSVAQFYSDLAKSYTRLYEQTNCLAATAFLQEHSSRLQNFHTLDLHYLYVKEAIPALDIFLDSNINLTATSQKKTENLFIITGRGKRSQGKSRLKPAVIARLNKRGLKWVELNPGLLKVKIHSYSVTTSNL